MKPLIQTNLDPDREAEVALDAALTGRDDRLEALKLAVAFVSSPQATGGISIIRVADEFLAWLRKEG